MPLRNRKNRNIASQPQSGEQPTLVSSQINGLPSLSFNGQNTLILPYNMMQNAQAGEIIGVVKVGNDPDNFSMLWNLGTGYGTSYYGTLHYDDFGTSDTTAVQVETEAQINQYYIYDTSIDSAGTSIYRYNGVPLWTRTGLPVGFQLYPDLGGYGNGSLIGNIAEVMVYNRVLTDTERFEIGQYLTAKYAFPSVVVPSAPTDVAAVAISSDTVDLSWTVQNPGNMHTVTTVERQTGSGAFVQVAQINDAWGYTDTGLAPGTSYTYQISIQSYVGTSGPSNSASATTPSNVPDPPSEGLSLWLRSTVGTEGTGPVSLWVDQSGLGNNANQNSSTNQPQLVQGQANGLPVVRFNGTNELVLPQNMLQSEQSGEIIALVKVGSNPDNFSMLWNFGTGFGTSYYNTLHFDDFGTSDTGAVVVETQAQISQYYVYDTSIDANGNSIYRYDGMPLWTRTGLSVGFGAYPDIGGYGGGNFVGDIAEIIVYNRVLSPQEQATIYSYFAAKYSLPSVTAAVASPAITSGEFPSGQTGQSFNFQVTASNSPTSFGASRLPPGLSMNSAGLISGTPTTGGSWNATVTATNASGSGSSPLFITISTVSPVITSTTSATGQVGQSFSYQIEAIGATSYSATGLPPGLNVDTNAGLISGNPTSAGSYTVALTAGNSAGSGNATLTIVINPPLTLISPATASGQVSQSFSYQVTTSNAVTDYAAAGLPDGLSIDPAAGLISGAPTTAGTYTVTLSLTDATGTSTATLTISVAPNFPVVSGMLLWLKADMGVTADSSGNVSQWTDQSGIGNNAFQSIAANQPVLVSNQFNGLPVVRFNGPNSLSLPYNMMQGAQAGEIIVVTKQTDTQDQANVLFDFGTGYGARYYDVYHYDDFGTNDISAIPPESESALQQYHVYNTSITADGTSTYSFNGVPEWTRTGLAVGFSQFPDIGGGFGGSFTGDMVEVILYSRVLSAAERGTIYGYLAQRYAMPSVVNNVNSPAITSASSVTGAVGQTFSFQITASNSPTSFGASGLPPGLSVSSTGLISGTPTTDGDFNASVTATNASGSGSSPLTFTINPAPPVITSATSATGQENQAFSYQIAATNNPTGYSATGLPTGLTVDPVAGLISGTPAVGTAGTFSVYLTATNSAGSGSATLNLAISVAAAVAPVITSATSATSQIELAFSYQITANNNPTSYAATGLPSGLTVDPVAGLISGTPTAAGSSTVTLTATNLAGSGTATLNITITGLTSSTPVITSATSVTGQINEAISYQITASNNPTSYSATGLPSGLTVDPVAGVISGTPTAAGATTVTLNATNSAGSGTATLNLVITTIPIYSTGFEPGDGFVVGALGGQNGWTVSQGTAVITAQVYRSGVQSLELVPGSSAAIAVQTFPAIPNETIEYCDFYAMPAAETQIGSSSIYTVEGAQFGFLQSGVLEAFYGDGNGGGSWVPTQFTVALGSGNETSLSWVRLTARLDFTAQTWDLYANGAMVAAAIPFINNSSIYLSTFQIQGDASSPFYIDDVYVGSMNPMFANISNDGISDAWKAQYGLSLTANDRNGDPTRGGVTNIQKYIAGTNPLDFYNGVAPYVVPLYTDPVSGQGVPGPNDDLAMTVAQFDGTPWPNAPVTFQITSGTRLISLVQGQGPYVSTLNVVTDSTGVARVYLQPLMSQ